MHDHGQNGVTLADTQRYNRTFKRNMARIDRNYRRDGIIGWVILAFVAIVFAAAMITIFNPSYFHTGETFR